LRRDAGNRFFAGGVNIQELDGRGVIEGVHELIHQIASARVAMRLENDVHCRIAAVASGAKSRANLRGVMSVVVDDRNAVGAAFDLESPVHPAEGT
jgi:hypothetical protein